MHELKNTGLMPVTCFIFSFSKTLMERGLNDQ
jgi:hypothetical protein